MRSDQKTSDSAQNGGILRFGPFLLDEPRRRLTREGVVVPLTAKAFDVLVALVANRDRVVSRSELLDRVWHSVVVEEANLTQTISVLRKALGEGAGTNEYVTTVPGHGYRFVAPVSEGGEQAADRPRRSRSLSYMVTAGVAVVLLMSGAWIAGRLSFSESSPSAELPPGSVAVLPFHDRDDSGGADLGLDVAEQVIGELTRDPRWRVRPPHDVLEFRDPTRDTPAAAGRQLGVEHVITGSISRRSTFVRVAAQMIRTSDASTVASIVFEEPAGDENTLDDRIASRILSELPVRR